MRNSGYVSVGHILANKAPEAHVETLRHFCTVVFCNVDDSEIHKSTGFWRYDQFFRSVPVSVESFAQFFGGLLRKRDSDELTLQLELERLAWDMVKFDFDRFICPLMVRKSLYQLFCLFNRFCSFQSVPMTLPENALTFILQELKLPFNEVSSLQDWSFSRLLQFVNDSKNDFEPKLLKRLYDCYVRDVLKEGRLRCRPMSMGGGMLPSGAADKTKKIVSVTSRELVVYDDDNGDLDQPSVSEPTGKVLHRLPLIDAETKVVKSGFGIGSKAKARTFLQVTSESRETPNLELIFDSTTENYDLFSWNQAVQEATYSTQAMQDRLSKIHLRLGFSTGNRRMDDPSRMSSVSEEGLKTKLAKASAPDGTRPRNGTALLLPPAFMKPINRSSSEQALFSELRGDKRKKSSSGEKLERRISPLALSSLSIKPLPPPAFLKAGRKKQIDLTGDVSTGLYNGNNDEITAESWKPLRKESINASRAY